MNMAEAPVKRTEISQYHKDLALLLKSEPDRNKRRDFLALERQSPEYQTAKMEAIYRLHPESPALTSQQRAILWAHKVVEEYSTLPKENHAERKRVKVFLEKTADRILQDPRLETAVSVWKAKSSESKSEFYEAIKAACAERTKQQWSQVTSAQLADFVKIYAHNPMIADFMSQVLRGYFRGPGGIRQRVDSMYKFVYGLIDLVFDRKALGAGLKIARFEDEVVPKDSSFRGDIVIAGVSLADDDLLIKAISINNSILGLSKLIYPEKKANDFLQHDHSGDYRISNAAGKAVKKVPREELIRRSEQLGYFYTQGIAYVEGGKVEQLSNTWLGRILNADDLLRKRSNKELVPLLIYEKTNKAVNEEAKKQGINIIPLSLRTPEGYILDIFLPDNIPIDEWRNVIKMALEEARLSEKDKLFMEREGLPRQLNIGLKHNNCQIWALVRKAAVTESDRHNISSLADIGFTLALRDSQEVADSIAKRQIRFLNRRGIRVPLSGKLRELGYSHIDFHKDANDSQKILVKIFVGDIAYNVRLDEHFNLDLEGKRLDSLGLAESLRYVCLSLLKPILCEERIKDPHLMEVGLEEGEVVSRMGHLRWLPEGQRFSKTAVDNYLRIEERDLFAANMQRLAEHDTKRETTYVKPVIEQEESLPPIMLHLPEVLKSIST